MTTEELYHQNENSISKIRKSPSIQTLALELERIDKELHDLPSSEDAADEFERTLDRLWTVRALINATPAQTPDQFSAKMKAFKLTMALDKEFECHVLGSAREQAKSLIDEAAAIIASCGSGNQ